MEMHCLWDRFPLNPSLLSCYPTRDINAHLPEFLRNAVQFRLYDSFKQLEDYSYEELMNARLAACIISAEHLMRGRPFDAVLMHIYGALLEECSARGFQYIQKYFTRPGGFDIRQMSQNFSYILEAIYTTTTVANFRSVIREMLKNGHFEHDADLRQTVKFLVLPQLDEMPNLTLHSMDEDVRDVKRCKKIRFKLVNQVNNTTTLVSEYKDCTLGWMLRMRNCRDKSFLNLGLYTSIVHTIDYEKEQKAYFIHESGDKTLEDIGMKDGDRVVIGMIPRNITIKKQWEEIGQPTLEKQLISTLGLGFITGQTVLDIWLYVAEYYPSDKSFNVNSFRSIQKAIFASYILAADFLLTGRGRASAYMILYAAMLEECIERGPDHLREFFCSIFDVEAVMEGLVPLSNYIHLQNAVLATKSRESIFCELNEKLTCFSGKGQKLLSNILASIETQRGFFRNEFYRTLHSLNVGTDLFETGKGELGTVVTTVNADNGTKYTRSLYTNTTLQWWLKLYAILCNYHPIMRSKEVKETTKYLRALHKGRPIFLSSSGKKTLSELGIISAYKHCELTVGGVEIRDIANDSDTPKARRVVTKSKKKKHRPGGKKKRSKPQPSDAALSEEQLMKKYKREHSKAMTPVFEELAPVLKVIRNQLNNLTLQKSPPKVKGRKRKEKKDCNSQIEQSAMPTDDCLDGKAGRVAYPVLVGEVANLYRTSKSFSVPTISVDLHGLSREDALKKLDTNLPLWIEIAMKGDHPWVMPVDIICGGGSQILSEAVKEWIRRSHRVANRPKGYAS